MSATQVYSSVFMQGQPRDKGTAPLAPATLGRLVAVCCHTLALAGACSCRLFLSLVRPSLHGIIGKLQGKSLWRSTVMATVWPGAPLFCPLASSHLMDAVLITPATLFMRQCYAQGCQVRIIQNISFWPASPSVSCPSDLKNPRPPRILQPTRRNRT